MSPFFSDTTLGGEELAHLPVALGEDVVGPADVVDVERRPPNELRQSRFEDGHAFRTAIGAHDHDHAPSGRPLDLAHESSAEPALAGGAAHDLQSLHVDDAPIHAITTGSCDASRWHDRFPFVLTASI